MTGASQKRVARMVSILAPVIYSPQFSVIVSIFTFYKEKFANLSLFHEFLSKHKSWSKTTYLTNHKLPLGFFYCFNNGFAFLQG